MGKVKTMKAASRTTTAPATAAADLDRTFGELARVVARYRADLQEFADEIRGPIPEGMESAIREMWSNAGDELANLAAIHGRG